MGNCCGGEAKQDEASGNKKPLTASTTTVRAVFVSPERLIFMKYNEVVSGCTHMSRCPFLLVFRPPSGKETTAKDLARSPRATFCERLCNRPTSGYCHASGLLHVSQYPCNVNGIEYSRTTSVPSESNKPSTSLKPLLYVSAQSFLSVCSSRCYVRSWIPSPDFVASCTTLRRYDPWSLYAGAAANVHCLLPTTHGVLVCDVRFRTLIPIAALPMTWNPPSC